MNNNNKKIDFSMDFKYKFDAFIFLVTFGSLLMFTLAILSGFLFRLIGIELNSDEIKVLLIFYLLALIIFLIFGLFLGKILSWANTSLNIKGSGGTMVFICYIPAVIIGSAYRLLERFKMDRLLYFIGMFPAVIFQEPILNKVGTIGFILLLIVYLLSLRLIGIWLDKNYFYQRFNAKSSEISSSFISKINSKLFKINEKIFELNDNKNKNKKKKERIFNLISSHAIGDSLLLPYEFLRKDLSIKRFNKFGIKQSLIFNYGMTSDDHDHLLMTYQALKHNNVVDFSISLSKKLRFWLLCLPIGIGKTTLFSIIKLWFGFSPSNSGINSSGNGPMMRIPVIASFFANDEEKRNSFIRASTVITHNSNQAISCCLGLGNFISYLYRNKALPKKGDLKDILVVESDQIWINYVDILVDSLYLPLEEFLEKINCSKGVTGYIMHSSIFSIYVLYHHKKEHIFSQIAKAGGDTDTIGAFCASCLSLINTNAVINTDNVKVLFLTDNDSNIKFWLFIILKNLLLIPIVLAHGIIRIVLKLRLRNL